MDLAGQGRVGALIEMRGICNHTDGVWASIHGKVTSVGTRRRTRKEEESHSRRSNKLFLPLGNNSMKRHCSAA